MVQLFTLVIRRKSLHCTDEGITVSYKEQILYAMPGEFVANFRRQFPNAVVSVSEHTEEDKWERRSQRALSSPEVQEFVKSHDHKVKPEKLDDYSDVVNKMMKEF